MTREAAAIQHVADRFLVRLAAQEACRNSGMRLASSGLTPDVVAAFAEQFYLPQHEGKVAFGGLVRKLKQMVDGFKHLPHLWDKFKKALGVESLSDLPGVIMDMAGQAKKALRFVLTKVFNTWPLKIYTLDKGKLGGINQLLDSLISKSPKFKQFIQAAAAKMGHYGEMVRKAAPHITGAVMVAVYVWVWFNVVEVEWDLKALTDAVSGALTFPDFLASLPGSAVGLLLNTLNLGTFTLLPVTLAARVLYMLANRYIEWTGRGFKVDWALIKADFHVEMPEQPASL